jgi:hypothetical protein
MNDWREQQFRNESDAYFRSLDQAISTPLEACAGYHIEDGQSICDWFRFQGRRISFRCLEDRTHVYVEIEGIARRFYIRRQPQDKLILAARKLAEKHL